MKSVIIAVLAIGMAACSDAARPVQQNANSVAAQTNDRPQSVIAHSSENQTPNTSVAAGDAPKSKWTQGGEAIDTTRFDASIKTAEKTLSAKPSDAAAKKGLGAAYFKRGFALTEARQYASALGDYRRAAKYDPENAEAKSWIDKIIVIYDGLKKEYPKEGEEPPPLPFTKEN